MTVEVSTWRDVVTDDVIYEINGHRTRVTRAEAYSLSRQPKGLLLYSRPINEVYEELVREKLGGVLLNELVLPRAYPLSAVEWTGLLECTATLFGQRRT